MTNRINTEIRFNMRTSGSRFVGVTFLKKNGDIRVMNIQQAAIRNHIVGSERGARMSATRRKNNPEIMPVYSVDSKGIRSIDLDRVLSVRADGFNYEFRDAASI